MSMRWDMTTRFLASHPNLAAGPPGSAAFQSQVGQVANETIAAATDDPTVAQFVNYLNDASKSFADAYWPPATH
jgi:hypothetical protein